MCGPARSDPSTRVWSNLRNPVIRAPAVESEIVITTTDRLAGAINSLTRDGHKFIDNHDPSAPVLPTK